MPVEKNTLCFFRLFVCINFPNRGNQERFFNLIDPFSQWEHGLHITKMISITSDPASEKNRSFAKGELRNWVNI
jgi:hypothetical protein